MAGSQPAEGVVAEPRLLQKSADDNFHQIKERISTVVTQYGLCPLSAKFKRVANNWIEYWRWANYYLAAPVGSELILCGLDVEKTNRFGHDESRCVSLLQIFVYGKGCFMIRLHQLFDIFKKAKSSKQKAYLRMLKSLLNFLINPNCHFFGVGVMADAESVLTSLYSFLDFTEDKQHLRLLGCHGKMKTFKDNLSTLFKARVSEVQDVLFGSELLELTSQKLNLMELIQCSPQLGPEHCLYKLVLSPFACKLTCSSNNAALPGMHSFDRAQLLPEQTLYAFGDALYSYAIVHSAAVRLNNREDIPGGPSYKERLMLTVKDMVERKKCGVAESTKKSSLKFECKFAKEQQRHINQVSCTLHWMTVGLKKHQNECRCLTETYFKNKSEDLPQEPR